jgi:phosphate transport system substrate-binding protein
VAREMLPYEESLFRNRPYKPYAIPVAGGSYDVKGYTDSLVVYVNANNPIQRLTLDQLDAIFSGTRKRGHQDITRWGEVGLAGEWADKPIHVYSNQMPNGHADSFRRLVLDGGEFKDTVVQLGHSADGVTAEGEAGARVTLKIAEDPYGIGYAGHYLAKPGTKKIALATKEAGPYFAGTFEEALNHSYPLSRFIYLYVNKWPNKPIDALAREFVSAALSREGQEVVAATPFLPLPAELVAKSRAMLQ